MCHHRETERPSTTIGEREEDADEEPEADRPAVADD